MIGQTISHYRILEKLGEGGMGEVYLAQDTGPLDRKVALKFPSQEMQQDPVARQRFLREARSAAALDHPYVCHIHEVGEDGEQSFISMEYIAGQSLKDRLAKGPLELKDALQKATEIAEALEAAHKQNIVHRDLKPANIMLTPEGHVKVMDFGLAKRLTPAEGPESRENTLSSGLTATGATLGTLPYMSPEQVRGQEVDSRSDIFSFGVVLYEMLTGVHPFKKDTPVETANAILNEASPLVGEHVANAPVLLQHTVRKMLVKEPDRRYQLVHDVRTDLGDLIDAVNNPSEAQAAVDSEATRPEIAAPVWWRRLFLWAVIGLVTVGAGWLLGLLLWDPEYDPQSTQARSIQFPVILPEGDRIHPNSRLALSPDGTKLVYTAIRGKTRQLYLRDLGELEVRPIPGTEGGWVPFFSPDGKWVGFFGDIADSPGELKKVSLLGGEPQHICEVGESARGASWGQDGTIIFGKRPGLWRVSETGGTPEQLTEDNLVFSPRILPDGRAVLFFLLDVDRIDVLSFETREQEIVISPGVQPLYVPTGHLIYYWNGDLLAVPFDLEELRVSGPATPVLEEVGKRWNFDISANGTLAYVPGESGEPNKTLVWVDRQGTKSPVSEVRRRFETPRLSPDGKRLAATADQNIWIYEIDRDIWTPLTVGGDSYCPIWTPDGSRITFVRRGEFNLFWTAADGTGEVEPLTTDLSQNLRFPTSWSPDRQALAYQESHAQRDYDLWVLPVGGEPKPFLATEFREVQPMFSPNGHWIAFTSNRSGRREIYVTRYPGGGRKEQISREGGHNPVWERTGKELFFRNGEKMMAVSIQTDPTFKAGTPKVLFEGDFYQGRGTTWPSYDITADGQRFVLVQADKEEAPTQINVVLNWFEELKRLVPTDN